MTDWSLALRSASNGQQAVPIDHRVVVDMQRDVVRWVDQDGSGRVFLEMSRENCLRMLVENKEHLDNGQIRFPQCALRVRLHRKPLCPGASVRYDPVAFQNEARHAPLVGGIVAGVMQAMTRCSADIAAEFQRFIRIIRGFEVSSSSAGVIQSFSDPTIPGVMGVNVPFTSTDEPRLNPLCFTWFAHELGHTKSYFLETIAHSEKCSFLTNGNELTPPIPRYGRALRVRTLLQIPYTHLYEWVLLEDFKKHRFQGLPWDVDVDPVPALFDLQKEIEESFALINRFVALTMSGQLLIRHLKSLFFSRCDLPSRTLWRGRLRAPTR